MCIFVCSPDVNKYMCIYIYVCIMSSLGDPKSVVAVQELKLCTPLWFLESDFLALMFREIFHRARVLRAYIVLTTSGLS